ncbi:hypothetical protein BH09PSE4_BH09PSE4_13780 [soil metagenome]
MPNLAADPRYAKPKPCFGRWLLDQAHRDDVIGELAKCAKSDRRFPADGDANAVSRLLNSQGADPDMHLALEEAELDYACY